MTNEDEILVTRNFLKHLTKGGVKIIPVFGGLLEEMIFGTLADEVAAEEAEKLWKAIESIRSSSDAQLTEVSELIAEIREGAFLRTETKVKLEELRSAMFEAEAISMDIMVAMRRYLQIHEKRIEDIVSNLELVVAQLAEASVPEIPDRIVLLKKLMNLTNSDLTVLVTAIEASSHVSDGSPVNDRASQLLRWAESSTGPGLARLMQVTRQIFPDLG